MNKLFDDEKRIKDMISMGTSRNVGLIEPNGIIHVVTAYEHINFLIKLFPEFQNLKQQHDDNIGYVANEFYNNIPEGEHPCWHNFEIWKDGEDEEFQENLLKTVYEKGWIRWGMFERSGKKYLEFEGAKWVLDGYKKDFNDLAEIVGYIPLLTEAIK